jgi:CDP-diacylglycerol--glycerol-3-phosphate 3-phosphatidyltransferase
MVSIWRGLVAGYLRLIEPIIAWCVRHRVSPNLITTVGTAIACAVGVLFGLGWFSLGGWTLGLLAFFDVVDGAVARRSGTATVFGSFYDATMDRVADAFLFGGFVVFYAVHDVPRQTPMLLIALVALVATQLTSYTRSRAELIGVDMKGVGWMERPERITLLAAPQAFFGRSFDGWVVDAVVMLLAVTAVVTVAQRMRHVLRATAVAIFPMPQDAGPGSAMDHDKEARQ